jgi:hypothetical protein
MVLLALLEGGILLMPLRADLQITVKETFPGGPTTTTVEYHKGNRLRRDSKPGGAYVFADFANKQSITVDPLKREYSVHISNRPEPAEDPNETIVIDIESRDTGEQRQMFGHPARHIVTTERRRTEFTDKPSTETQEIVTDGWYIEVPGLKVRHSRIGAVAVFRVYSVDQHGRQTAPKMPKIIRNDPAPHGLAVWEKSGNSLSEVTELSEAPLDEKLFEIPEGFHRVVNPLPGDQLSWSDQLLFHWQEFLDWLDGFF